MVMLIIIEAILAIIITIVIIIIIIMVMYRFVGIATGVAILRLSAAAGIPGTIGSRLLHKSAMDVSKQGTYDEIVPSIHRLGELVSLLRWMARGTRPILGGGLF
jgi:uncharacterized membrane protein YqjE